MSDAIRRTILELAAARGVGRSFCPSEVARALAREEARWRALMPEVRREARALVVSGEIIATQRGAPVDPVMAKGPIRLARAARSRED